MWSKFSFGFLSAMNIVTTLGTIATVVKAAALAEPEPEAVVAVLHTFKPQGLCHCVRKRYSMAVDETATGRCLSLPEDFQPGAADVTGDWNVFVFETANCTDKGAWIFPQTTQNPSVMANMSLGADAGRSTNFAAQTESSSQWPIYVFSCLFFEVPLKGYVPNAP